MIASLLQFADSPLSWAIAGFAIGLALGVNAPSVWLVAAGLGGFVLYLRLHGPAQEKTEGRLFSGGGVFMMAWLAGLGAWRAGSCAACTARAQKGVHLTRLSGG